MTLNDCVEKYLNSLSEAEAILNDDINTNKTVVKIYNKKLQKSKEELPVVKNTLDKESFQKLTPNMVKRMFEKCSLCSDCQKNKLQGIGKWNSEIVFVLEKKPTLTEEETLKKMLGFISLYSGDRFLSHITFLNRCDSKDKNAPENCFYLTKNYLSIKRWSFIILVGQRVSEIFKKNGCTTYFRETIPIITIADLNENTVDNKKKKETAKILKGIADILNLPCVKG